MYPKRAYLSYIAVSGGPATDGRDKDQWASRPACSSLPSRWEAGNHLLLNPPERRSSIPQARISARFGGSFFIFRQKADMHRHAEHSPLDGLQPTPMSLYYAGIGSRETPDYVLDLMEKIATELRRDGYTLRSGHAQGADQAFERGAMGNAQIFLPWARFEDDVPVMGEMIDHPTVQAHEIAARYHPAWGGLKPGAKSMHARNVHQILGKSCNSPVDFVICWTPNASIVGGTGQSLRIAYDLDIPVRNLADPEMFDESFEWVWGD